MGGQESLLSGSLCKVSCGPQPSPACLLLTAGQLAEGLWTRLMGQLQGHWSIRFCTWVLRMRRGWHLRWLVRAGTLLSWAERKKRRARRAGSVLLRLALLFCWADCDGHLQRGQRSFLESGSAYPSLPFSAHSAFSRRRSPAVSALPRPCALAAGGAGRVGAAVPRGMGRAGAAPAVPLHRPTRRSGLAAPHPFSWMLEVVSCFWGISVQLFL